MGVYKGSMEPRKITKRLGYCEKKRRYVSVKQARGYCFNKFWYCPNFVPCPEHVFWKGKYCPIRR